MKLHTCLTVIVTCSIITDVLSQNPVVTYLLSRNQSLQCLFTNEALTVTWRDSDTTPDPTSLATYKLLPERVIDVENDGGKYSNFEYSANDVNFNLAIINVEEEDGGNYLCLQSPGGVRSSYIVMVEVPPDETAVACSSCTSANSAGTSCNCQCSALGGSSPSILRLEWKINDEVLASQPPTENGTNEGQTVYSCSAVVPVEEDESVVTCAVTGFENQDEIADQFPSRVAAEQTLSSPVCSVSVSDGNCPTVELSCSCDAYPSVPDSPEYFSYYSRKGKDDSGSDTLLNDTLQVVTPGSDIYFVCTGDNGLGVSTKSAAVPNPCPEDTITFPPSTSDAKIGDGCPQRSAPALIAICCVEGVFIIVIIFVFGFLYTIRKGSRKEDVQSLATHPYNASDKTNTAYMDLQETKQISSDHVNVDIPFENLSLQASFPSKGLMKYRKAQMTLTSKREEIVVKTVSDDAPVRLAKLQADEVQLLATLSSNANVAQFLGRCNNVPNLLCYEFVNGTTLGEYLRENFQPSKIHQYGNTKQKRYHVPEKGSVESLPKVALQIARGMKYLTVQKFLHPGLRSEKVIMDASSQCKLYDFVSNDNAKDIMAILWSKFVPYQWMPPEYLFLEKLDPSVDVWSFGVLMWEIFSYGAVPHKGKSRRDVEKELRGKENLPLPNNCPGAIWQITLNCWDQSPEKRPSFDHLSLQLSHMCNDNKEYDEIQSK